MKPSHRKLILGNNQLGSVPITFTRPSVAHDINQNPKATNTPRYNYTNQNEGILIEKESTNILDPNMADCGDTSGDTTGFTTTGTGTVALSIDDGVQFPTKSLKVAVTSNTISTGYTTLSKAITPNKTYTAEFVVRGTGNIKAILIERNVSDVILGGTATDTIALSETPQIISVSRPITANGRFARIGIYTAGAAQATFYVNMAQLEESDVATSITSGGNTRSAETLTIPANTLNPTQGSIYFTFLVNNAIKTLGINRYVFDANGTGYIRFYHSSASDVFKLDTNNGTDTTTITTEALANGSHSACIVYSATELQLWIDGVQIGSTAENPNLPTLISTINIGCLNTGAGHGNTSYKDVAFYNDVHNATQIITNHSKGTPIVTRQTTLHMPLGGDLRAQKARTFLSTQQYPYIYNKESLNIASTIQNLADSSKLIINSIGDSITTGNHLGTVTECMNNSFVGLLRTLFKNKHGNVGMGFIPAYTVETANYFTKTGTWSQVSLIGSVNAGYYTNENGATISTTFTGTGINIYIQRTNDSGSIDISIDGGTATTHDCSGLETVADVISITGLTDTTHTITITKTSDSSKFYLIGVEEIKGTHGVQVNMMGLSGATADDISDASLAFMTSTYWEADLTIIAFFANDYAQQRSVATYKEDIRRIITSAKLTGDVILLCPTILDTAIYPGETLQSAYRTALLELSSEEDVCFIDMNGYWGEDYSLITGKMYDGVHLNSSGHQDILTLIRSVIVNG
jgi:lysophospholipase L1-like esterase